MSVEDRKKKKETQRARREEQMRAQQVLIVTRVALFQITEDSKTVERGNCACAIVASPGTTPARFSIVCYNDQRETLCTSAIKSSNDHSLQFQLQVNDYASFRDDKANKWSMMFLKSAHLEKFCAVLGSAFFTAGGLPMHTAVIADFSPPNIDSRVSLQHRVKARYTAYALRLQPSNGLYIVEDALETNGERPYNFQPTQSAMAREDAKGFESCVLGMAEEGTRAIVVPASIPRAGRSPYAGVDVVVFVVQIIRVLADALHVEGSNAVPVLYGEGGNSGALVLSADASPSGALTIGSLTTATSTNRAEVPLAAAAGVPGAPGSGVPAEHMMMIQKAASMINSSTTMTRDLHDKIYAFNEDWKQSVNRPKPSTLTNQGLEQSVKQLIMENEKMRDDLVHRDELIRSLDDRNRDLQKRVDTAAMVAQQLMDEKNKTVTTTSDMKLEKDRIVMKLQEQVTACSNERDDVHRHMQTVKKLLDVSDNELRDVKGKIDVHTVQAQSLASKLDAAEDSLAEERSRRKALEAKVLALQEEIREAEADLHTRTAALEELHRKADSERTYQAQLMEDERQRRSFEAQQLRSEIVGELQQREAKFLADRARVAEDHFKRGHDEGKQIGRNHARIDVEARLEELVLDAQRAKTELDAYKTELRGATDEAMAENRRLESIVMELKKSTDEGTRRKAQNEFQLHALRLKVRNAEDSLLLSMTSVAHRLTRPAAPIDLVSTLASLKDGDNPKLQFQLDAHKEEKEQSYAQRYVWMVEDAEQIYAETISSTFQQHVAIVEDEGKRLRDAIGDLWRLRDAANRADVIVLEENERRATEDEAVTYFSQLDAWRRGHIDEQKEVMDDAAKGHEALDVEADADISAFVAALRAFIQHQADERKILEDDETTQRESDESAMNQELHSHAGGFLVFLENQRNERDAIYAEEEAARGPLEHEGVTDFYEAIETLRTTEREERGALSTESEATHTSMVEEEQTAWRDITHQHELVLFAGLIAAQEVLSNEESEAREPIAQEEASDSSELFAAAATEYNAIAEVEAERKRIQDELDATEAAEARERSELESSEAKEVGVIVNDMENDLDTLKSVAAAMPTGASALNRNSVVGASSSTSAGANNASASPMASQPQARDFDDPLLGASGVRSSLVVESSNNRAKSPFGGGSSSDDDNKARKPAPVAKKAPAKQSAASPTAKAASPTNKMFGSDSDEDSDGAAKPKKAPPKKAAAKKAPVAKRAALFDSDDD
ncbi:transmembrane protein, putative [Bodo saltans]|uniref:Transmembrane protein, putative n=1 Tax=Bodo saltans TaxID=75058 RepID=A0A0S4JFL0_BODSA|nr:transmembrane protein, putative [Bodo saltans]|eukprot:CUG88831.1 transmembrane protein, putative [Bodo saltans]